MGANKNMNWAEFEEAAYEAPLYNQLECGNNLVYTPGRVLEKALGFDRGIYIATGAVWGALGYAAPPHGIALGYYRSLFGPASSVGSLPRFRLNIFIQAKRPVCFVRRPRKLNAFTGYKAPIWAFFIEACQQQTLERLADRAGRKAHVTYAAPAFNTRGDLYAHTVGRSIVQHSTFPSVLKLKSHEAWYYNVPGSIGIANPNPELIEEQSLLDRIAALSREPLPTEHYEEFGELVALGRDVVASVQDTDYGADPTAARFMNDLQTLERLMDPFDLRPVLRAYAVVLLFAFEFGLTWLVRADFG